MQSTRVQLRRRVGTGVTAPTAAQVVDAEPAYRDPSPGGNGVDVTGVFVDELYIGHAGAIAPSVLVGATRQLELRGEQHVQTGTTNAKWFDLTNFKLTGGANANLLATDGSGTLAFVSHADISGLISVNVSAPLTGNGAATALGLTMADAAQITAGTNTVNPVSAAGLRGITGDLTTLTTAVTARGSLVDAINDVVTTVGALDLGVTTNASLTGDGTTTSVLAIAPASAAQVTTGSDNIQAITSLRLREVTGALVDLDTSVKTTLVDAINDIQGAVATLQSGVTPVGTFNAATNVITPFSGSPAVPGPLPAPTAANKGWVLYVTVAGTGGPSPPAPGVALALSDQLMSPGTGAVWDHIPLGVAGVVASGVTIDAITGMTGVTTVQGALEDLHTKKLSSLNLDTDIFDGDGVTTALTVKALDGGVY